MQQTIEGFRLSPQQARLWQIKQQHALYNTHCLLHITGELDISLLQNALNTLLSQYKMFCTTFQSLPGMKEPVQIINEKPLYRWHCVDHSSNTREKSQLIIDELLREEKTNVFDLEHGPLCHCTLLLLNAHSSMLFLHFSAFYADAQTLLQCAQKLPQLYFDGLAQAENTQEEETPQYLQFSEWQNALLEDEENHNERTFWEQQIVAEHDTLTLPFEQKKAVPAPFTPGLLNLSLSPALRTQILQLLQAQQCSLSTFFLSCWYALLLRLTGKQTVQLGLEVDGRIYEELAYITGPMAKYIPFTSSLSEQNSFLDLLQETQKSHANLIERQVYFTYADITPPAEEEFHILYPFCFQNLIYPVIATHGATSFALHHCSSCYEPYKVKVVAVENAEALALEFHYDTHLYTQADVQRIAECFQSFIEHAVRLPSRMLDIDIVSSRERLRLLGALKQTNTQHSRGDLCVHHLFEQQVARTPDSIVVHYAETQLSAHILNQRANQLAHHLRQLGVGPEVYVGLCLERSAELLIAILGVLKAGGVYIPLETVYPQERLTFMANDAQMTLVVTHAQLQDRAPACARPVLIDTDWPTIALMSTENIPPGSVLPENLAYVLYTSGSSGQPKGVMVPHRGLAHYVQWASVYYNLATGSSVPVHSPLSFDLTITSLFAPLIMGCRILLVSEIQGVEALTQAIRQGYDFSLIKITPAHLDLLSRSLAPPELAHVAQTLVIGGEALSADTIAPWQRLAPHTRIINEYGPTETVVGCCIYEVAESADRGANVPIGRPIPNTQCYVLDPLLRPVPQGVPGELYIGGVDLGRGYLHHPALTAERFIAHPFSEEPGMRLYKTGDLVRSIADDGTLEYLGRLDRQVKLRGYRIELDEVETVLQQHPNVQEASVLLRTEETKDAYLDAYLVPLAPAPPLTTQELRDFLRPYVPAYMIPSTFTFLKCFPLTANGKVDWRLLASSEKIQKESRQVEMAPAQTIVQPRDAIELQLLQIWQEILQQQPISVVDNFFDLGGHSMLAISLIARILKLFGQDLPLATLFLHPTIADLAMLLRHHIDAQHSSALVGIQVQGTKPPFFCVHPAGGNVFCYANLARHLGPDQPFYGLQTPDPGTISFASVEEMAAHYITAIQEVLPHGPYLLGGWSMGGIVAFEMAQQLSKQGYEVPLLAIIDSVLATSEKRARTLEGDEYPQILPEEVVQELINHFQITVPEDFLHYGLDEQLSYTLEQAKKVHGFTGDTSFEQVHRIVSIRRANARIARLYIPQPYPRPLDYFITDDGMKYTGNVKNANGRAEGTNGDYSLNPWRAIADEKMRVHHIASRHTELVEEPYVQKLALALSHCMENK